MLRALVCSLIYSIPCIAGEESYLYDIKQLTFPSMGFEKAGEAYFSPDDQTILFQAIPTGEKEYQIYRMNIQKGVPELVSTGFGACTCAYFHPTCKKIIFASSHEGPNQLPEEKIKTDRYSWELTPYMNIYEANLDGSDLKALTEGQAYHAECSYSPDGNEIVFASNVTGSMNLYVMKSNGSDIRQITHTKACYNGGPFFTADGTKILFRADREKKDYLQIYTINKDGTLEIKLTDNEAINWAPYPHPEGQVIAYTTSLYSHNAYAIQLMNIYTRNELRLTYGATFDGLPVFSHDGNKLLWTSKRGIDRTCQIFIANFNMPEEIR